MFRTFRHALKDKGILFLEVPDCAPLIDAGDASMLWDQHTFYFTKASLERVLAWAGFDCSGDGLGVTVRGEALVAIARKTEPFEIPLKADEILHLSGFFERYLIRKNAMQKWVGDAHNEAGVALLGAGHIACAFINFFCNDNYFDHLLDDHPQKLGRWLAACKHQIAPTSSLDLPGAPRVVLHSLSCATRERIAGRLDPWIARGGRLFSIFASRPDSIPIDS